MSLQPASEAQYSKIAGTAAGTAVIVDRPAVLYRIIIPANKTGTIDLYDSATAAGTSATNLLASIPHTVGTIPTSVELGFRTKVGITYIIGGTTDCTLVWN